MIRHLGVRSIALAGIFLVSGCGPSELVDLPRPDLSEVTEQTLLDAVQAAQDAVNEEPQSHSAWEALGHVYLMHDWETEAVRAYRTGIGVAPDASSSHYYLAKALEPTDAEGALTAVESSIALDPTYAPAHVLHANLLRGLGRFDEAVAALDVAEELDPSNPFSQLGLGQLALQGGSLDVARAHLERALELNPGQSEAHQAMAQVLTALGEIEGAEAHAQRAAEPTAYVPMDDPLWRDVEDAGATRYYFALRGQRYLRALDFERAVEELSRAVAPDEKAPMLWYNYGAALLGAGQTDDAITALERALLATGNEELEDEIEAASMVRIFTNLGLAYARVGDLERAEAVWRQGLEGAPAAFELLNNLTTLLYGQDRLEEAIELLQGEDAAASDPRLTAILVRLLSERR
jgi:tetratricopeptide (TPR) repeat protein